MPIHDLGSDVLLYICALVDLFTIVSLSRVNHELHAVTSTKQLWLSVIHELSSRCLIEPLAADILDTISVAELIDEIKKVIVGPQTWSSASSGPPIVARQIDFSFTELSGESGSPQLLPDGRHILFYKRSGDFTGGVECWDMHSLRRVWGWASPPNFVRRATFDFRQGAAAVVALLFRSRIVLLEAWLNTGDSLILLDIPINELRWSTAKISGDFCACRLCLAGVLERGPLLLVNWRTAEFIVLRISSMQDFALIPDHLLLACSKTALDSSPAGQVRIYPMSSFGHLWRPVSEFTLGESTLGNIPSSTVHVHGNDLQEWNDLRISVTESLVHDDTYELTVEVRNDLVPRVAGSRVLGVLTAGFTLLMTNNVPPARWATTVSRYNLGLSPTAHSLPIVPQAKSIFRYEKQVPMRLYTSETSAAGNNLSWDIPRPPPHGPGGGVRDVLVYAVDSAGLHTRKLPIPDAEAPNDLVMARTGAVMFTYPSRIVICNYI
ncbi:hypothetical protein DFH09DRAFT_1281530 [Mycena vulgaris]|nr:hypothetical protein DFH09DRAFT_1281530 [Mycena vulgaris]